MTDRSVDLLVGGAANVSVSLNLTDSFSFTDTQVFVRSTSFTDSITFGDGEVQNFTKTLSDSFGFSDSVSTTNFKTEPLSDSFTVSDSQPAISFVKALTDSFTVADTIAKVIAPSITDTITFTDSTTEEQAFGLILSDSFSFSDSETFAQTKVFTDSVTFSDSEAASVIKVLGPDSFSLTDVITEAVGHLVTLTDSFSVADATPIKSVIHAIADSTSLTDVIAKSATHVLTDSFTFGDTTVRVLGRNITDTISFGDSQSEIQNIHRTLPTDSFSLVDFIGFAVPFIEILEPRPAQGLVQGGTPFTLVGTALNMHGLQEDFHTGALEPIRMTDASTGSGVVTVIAGTPTGTLQLDTGTTANSSAVVTTIDGRAYTDVEITGLIPATTLLASKTAKLQISLGLINPISTDVTRLILELSPSAPGVYSGTLVYYSTLFGAVQVNQALQAISLPAGAPFRLRLLYANGRTMAFLSGTKVFDTPTGIGNCIVEMRAANDPMISSQLIVSITKYTPIPVIIFGTEPAQYLSFVNNTRVDGLTPGTTKDQTVNIISSAWAGTLTLQNAWKYFYAPALTNVRQGVPSGNRTQGQITLVSDPAVKGGQPD